MQHARTFDEAMRRAFDMEGKSARVAVIPDGLAVIVR
jgi:nickel-dependent lactate racemase